MKSRTAAANQIHSLCDTAPDEIRAQLAGLSMPKKIAVAERWRPGPSMTPANAAKRSIASVARRWRALDDEARTLQRHMKEILDGHAASLLAVHGVGYDTASQLLITAGDNPHRLHNERSFAALCGATPVPDSSGRTNGRLRLNRGGDRHANSALWRIVIVRMATHPETKVYVERRTKEGMPTIEIIRCLKRYVARELFPHMLATAEHPTSDLQPAPRAA
jgi:transposase